MLQSSSLQSCFRELNHLEPLQHDPVLRSFCKHPPAIKSVDRMTAWNLECARRRAHDTKEARLARQQALAARARAPQTTEACAWAHRLPLSLRGLQQVSVNQGLVIEAKKNLRRQYLQRGRARHRRRKLVPWHTFSLSTRPAASQCQSGAGD